MFFRRKKPQTYSFDQRLQLLRDAGFQVDSQGGAARVSKLGCAATIEPDGLDSPKVGKAGVVVGDEIGYLVHGGYQSFFQTPNGRIVPALAEHLQALHRFNEDLCEALGITSLYNTSLGTVYNQHMYDRVKDRDAAPPPKPWEAHVRKDR